MPYEDLGRKIGGPEVAASPMKEKTRVSYPGFHIERDSVPDLKVGKEIEAKIKLKLNGFRKNDYGEGKYSIDFDITAIEWPAAMAEDEDEKEESLQDKIEEGLTEKSKK